MLPTLMVLLAFPSAGPARSQPFPVLPPIKTADPAIRSYAEFRVPTRLGLRRHGDTVFVEAVPVGQDLVRLAVGKDMITGLRSEWTFLQNGKPLLAGSGGLQGGRGPFGNIAAALPDVPGRGKCTANLKLTVFETDIPTQHEWAPETGRYRVLWTKNLTLGFPPPAGKFPVGTWNVAFANGVQQVCTFGEDGTAAVEEPGRKAPAKVRRQGVSWIVAYADDRTERWTSVGPRMVVEHWHSSAGFPEDRPILGIAEFLV